MYSLSASSDDELFGELDLSVFVLALAKLLWKDCMLNAWERETGHEMDILFTIYM